MAVVGGAKDLAAADVHGALDYFHDGASPAIQRIVHDGGQAGRWATRWAVTRGLPVQGYPCPPTNVGRGVQRAELVGKGQPGLVLYWPGGEAIAREAVVAGIQAVDGETGVVMPLPDGHAGSEKPKEPDQATLALDTELSTAEAARIEAEAGRAPATWEAAASPPETDHEHLAIFLVDEFGDGAAAVLDRLSDAAGDYLDGLGKSDLAALSEQEWRRLLTVVAVAAIMELPEAA